MHSRCSSSGGAPVLPLEPPVTGRLTQKRFWGRVEAVKRLAQLKGAKFPGDTPEKKLQRIARAVVDPAYFNVAYLPHYFSQGVADFHREMYRALMVDEALVVEVPRGHGKSTTITFAYALHQAACAKILKGWADGELDEPMVDAITDALIEQHELLIGQAAGAWDEAERGPFDPSVVPEPDLVWDPYIQIGAVIIDLAEEFTEAIKVELERNDRLLYDFGELISDPGVNYGDFIVGSGDWSVRIKAFSMKSGVLGSKHGPYRPTLCIVDDPDNDLTLSNRKLRDKQQATLGKVRFGLHPDHRIMVVGTRRHHDCLTARLMRLDGFNDWRRIRYQAYLEDGATPLWPDRWSPEKLAQLKREDRQTFETEMMNNPPGDGERLFPVVHTFERGGLLDEQAQTAICILDPSMGKSEKSDYQAIVTQRFGDTGPVLQVREDLLRLPPLELMRTFAAIAAEEGAAELVMETIGFQQLLVLLLEIDPAIESTLPPIVQIESQQHSKHIRIGTLATEVRQKRYLLPSDGSCYRTERQMLDHGERGVKVDALDAAEMGVRRARQLRQGIPDRARHGRRRRSLAEAPVQHDTEQTTGRRRRRRRMAGW
jgi:hypothetical protein